MRDEKQKEQALDEVEAIKAESRGLRGRLHIGLEETVTGGIEASDTKVIKFHGIYEQDDRDVRSERKKAKLEPLYSYMLRVRIPGGVLNAKQWQQLSVLAREYANGTLRLTTRQAVQFHGIYKEQLRPLVRGLDAVLLDSIAACGDVNRNVMCTPNPLLSPLHASVQRISERLSRELLPESRAYQELWLEGRDCGGEGEVEPLYGQTYLPRKFKIAVAVPPLNDVDVFAHDIGFIAIESEGRLQGFNVSVGGGLGMSHDVADTHPRLGDVIGFCPPQDAVRVAEAIVSIQRDYGNRVNRKRSRLKYTIEDYGLDWFRKELDWRLRKPLAEARPYQFHHNGDRYGWVEAEDGLWHLTLFVENGRLNPDAIEALEEVVGRYPDIEFRVSPNQNLIIAGATAQQKLELDLLLEERGLTQAEKLSAIRLRSMACVAFPTCPLAMAEAERYLPSLLDRVEALLEKHGLGKAPITLRMTGCPNGCARPYLAEIGLVGKGPGRYNLYLGGAFNGERLNRIYRDNANEQEILTTLDMLFARYARGREENERFGDYLIRVGVTSEVISGQEVREHDHGKAVAN
ncbi:sulfite reductase (NADPH) hemoprotein beta-component [Natronospira proteinivora]|uniref:Sulfite reductase [NADPH] hemoprotein beta-component n=1 Tax=Natronospira proteinivora TaxID=1807133 RepID=A0ABT1GBY2_9GAMM|nr:NADPH-dependent assimilatory sulfite reductase hemoprotein subunit [Natronospira proteinivora]MCP1727793.1 sulfite reductase (NADPH) hemoprotein beta-component [Natronospira proteinivora]